jgi:Tfp pilus assembly protein PilP
MAPPKPVTAAPSTKALVAISAPPSKSATPASTIAPKAGTKPPVANAKVETPAAPATEIKKVEAPKVAVAEPKKWAMNGKRDPFFSPVVQQNSGSGCSTGKKCLEIGQINVRGVVKSESGFIAVVTNSMNKAYFLHENDPVFNGFVVKITGDSVVFQETMQDKLGKPFTREVTKRITTPAV